MGSSSQHRKARKFIRLLHGEALKKKLAELPLTAKQLKRAEKVAFRKNK